MESLPLEILQYIFALACTDGGHTGNALSLTSKDIRAASRTVRFHTVTLIANPRRLDSFLALYERECEQTEEARKPRVRHLYAMFPRIGDRGAPRSSRYSLSPPPRPQHHNQTFRDRESPKFSSGSPNSTLKRGALNEERLDADETRGHLAAIPAEAADSRGRQLVGDPTTSPAYFAAARRLFQFVAPDLRTLILRTGFRDAGGPLWLELFTAPFPALKSLTLFEVATPTGLFPKSNNDAVSQDQGPLFPGLTHLHLLPTQKGYYYQLKTWASHAPRITHLRMSGIRASNPVVDQLALAVGVVPPSITSGRRVQEVLRDLWEILTFKQLVPGEPVPPPPMPMFGELRYLLVQPGPAPDDNEMDRLSHHDGVKELMELAEACRAAGVQAVVLPSSEKKGPDRMYLEQVRKDWIDMVSGTGAGVWTY
ncbi:hypothetical protein C8Q73DRAFT_470618 [Cubamyces lactineus]|nr:hypothetical protein C8Q73DRAFT_470618 [Cubamyces lactineus]